MWVAVPGSQIHMIKAERTEGVANPFGPHVAFEVEDFEEAKRTLDERGLSYTKALTECLFANCGCLIRTVTRLRLPTGVPNAR